MGYGKKEELSEADREIYTKIDLAQKAIEDADRMLFRHHMGVILKFVWFLACCGTAGALLFGIWW